MKIDMIRLTKTWRLWELYPLCGKLYRGHDGGFWHLGAALIYTLYFTLWFILYTLYFDSYWEWWRILALGSSFGFSLNPKTFSSYLDSVPHSFNKSKIKDWLQDCCFHVVVWVQRLITQEETRPFVFLFVLSDCCLEPKDWV